MIPREKCLEWAKEANISTDWHPATNEIEALINRAYAEGQKDMRERVLATSAYGHIIADEVRNLEIT